MGQEDDGLREKAWERFVLKHKLRIEQFEKQNPPRKEGKVMLPAHFDGKEWSWVSRAERRSGRFTK